MKKLMTALSAAALAMGAFATDYHNESFEGTDPLATGWTDVGDSAVVDGQGGTGSTASRVTYWTNQSGDFSKSLSVKTAFSAPAWCDVVSGGSSTSMSNVYYDSWVKLTACDEDITLPTADAKIAVWLKEMTDSAGAVTGTNLFVTAGKIGSDGTLTSANYNCGAVSLGEWSRLTIKMIDDVQGGQYPAFVVFVDANVATCTDSKGFTVADLSTQGKVWNNSNALFPSIVNSNSTISQVGYAGQCGVDDISFLPSDDIAEPENGGEEFAKDIDQFIISWTASDVKSVTANKGVEMDGKIYVPVGTSSVDVDVNVVYADGMMADTWEYTGDGNGVDGHTFTVAAAGTGTIKAKAVGAYIGDTPYGTAAEALTALNGMSAKGTYTLKLNAAAGEMTLNNNYAENGVEMVLDLAGKTITTAAEAETAAIQLSKGALKIIDTVGNGTVNGGDQPAVQVEGGSLTIDAGIYNGTVGGTIAAINGGSFSYADNADEEGKCTIVATEILKGYALAKSGDYWVLNHVGQGTSDDPRLIFTIADLKAVKTGAASAGFYYKLANDITVDEAWAGIGETEEDVTGDNSFQGTFDGDGKTITVAKFTAASKRGFFNSLYNATVKNLTVDVKGFDLSFEDSLAATDAEYQTGGAVIAGQGHGVSTIENCTAKGFLYGTFNVAGIVAEAYQGVTIKDCVNYAVLTGAYSKVAGMITYLEGGSGTTYVEGCVNYGSIVAHSQAGARYASRAFAKVGPGSDGVSGIFAYPGSAAVVIKDCSNQGTLSALNDGAVLGSLCGKSANAVTFEGTNTMPTTYKSVGGGNCAAAAFATVADDVATLVNSTDIVKDGSVTYKVMAAGGALTLARGEIVKLDQALTTAAVTAADTAADEITTEVVDTVTTFTCSAKTIAVTGVSLDVTEKTLKVGETFTLTATITPEDATDKTVAWESDDTTVATVGENGEVTAVGVGEATITVTTTDGGKTATCKVTVKASGEPSVPEEQGSIVVTKDPETGTTTIDVTPAEGATEIEILNIDPEDVTTIVKVPSSVMLVKGASTDQVRITFTAAETGAPTYDITEAFTLNGDAKEGVTRELNPDGSVTIEVDGEEVTIPVTPTAIESTEGTIAEGAVATKAIPGLTYELKRMANVGDEPASIGEDGIKQQAVTTTVSLKDTSDDKPADKAFYVIEVSK